MRRTGRDAVISGWIAGVTNFSRKTKLNGHRFTAVGLAIPGPYERYGVFGQIAEPACELLRLTFTRIRAALANRLAARCRWSWANDGITACGRGAIARGNSGPR